MSAVLLIKGVWIMMVSPQPPTQQSIQTALKYQIASVLYYFVVLQM